MGKVSLDPDNPDNPDNGLLSCWFIWVQMRIILNNCPKPNPDNPDNPDKFGMKGENPHFFALVKLWVITHIRLKAHWKMPVGNLLA